MIVGITEFRNRNFIILRRYEFVNTHFTFCRKFVQSKQNTEVQYGQLIQPNRNLV
nr:MAG TPA: hypothetical protein [Caudoviricetes sp.]